MFFISDTHFYHTNIIKYCDRPFADVDDMNKQLVQKWNSVVKKNENVYHLGDFALGANEQMIAELVASLNGNIKLVLGNHDYLSVKRYYECGFNRVYDKPIVIEDWFVLSHKPVMSLPSNSVFANIHGHVHNDVRFAKATSKTFNASCENIGYTPVTFEYVVRAMEQAEQNGEQ